MSYGHFNSVSVVVVVFVIRANASNDDRNRHMTMRFSSHSVPFFSVSFSRCHALCAHTVEKENRILNQYVILIINVFVMYTEMKRPLTIVGYLGYWFDSIVAVFVVVVGFFERFSCLVFVLLTYVVRFALCLFCKLQRLIYAIVSIFIFHYERA